MLNSYLGYKIYREFDNSFSLFQWFLDYKLTDKPIKLTSMMAIFSTIKGYRPIGTIIINKFEMPWGKGATR